MLDWFAEQSKKAYTREDIVFKLPDSVYAMHEHIKQFGLVADSAPSFTIQLSAKKFLTIEKVFGKEGVIARAHDTLYLKGGPRVRTCLLYTSPSPRD